MEDLTHAHEHVPSETISTGEVCPPVERLVKLPLPDGMRRMESGPVQFGEDDWPGVFLRGDNALGLMGLVSDLRSCKAT